MPPHPGNFAHLPIPYHNFERAARAHVCSLHTPNPNPHATGGCGEVEAPTVLIETAEGRAALLRYAATKKGKSIVKYLPAQFGAM